MMPTAYATPPELAQENGDQAFVLIIDQDGDILLPATDCEPGFDDLPWSTEMADAALALAGFSREQPWATDAHGRLQAEVTPQLREGVTLVRWVVQHREPSGAHVDAREFNHPGPALAYLRAHAPLDDTLRIVRREQTVLHPRS